MILPSASIIEFLVTFLFLLFIFVAAYFKKSKIASDAFKGAFYLSLCYRILFSLFFAVFYAFVLKGGDTLAYWDGANTLNNLFFDSPMNYIDCMISDSSPSLFSQHFNSNTGFPPGWIYREKEGWIICKIASILSIITFKSYFAMTLIIAYLSFAGSWRLMELIAQFKTHAKGNLLFAFMFIPSVCFWCSGLSKDGIVYVLVLYLLINTFEIISENRLSIKRILVILIASYLIYYTRSFILIAFLASVIFAYGARLTKKFESSPLAKISLRLAYIVGGFFIIFMFFKSTALTNLITEANIIQQDFVNNEVYTGKKYELISSDVSPIGLLKSFPEGLLFGIYRPYITESLSISLFLNGLESILFIFLTLRFFLSFNILNKLKKIRKNEFLLFSFVFILIIGFMAGFTSILFGVLVRIRAIILPFVYLILTVRGKKETTELTEVKSS